MSRPSNRSDEIFLSVALEPDDILDMYFGLGSQWEYSDPPKDRIQHEGNDYGIADWATDAQASLEGTDHKALWSVWFYQCAEDVNPPYVLIIEEDGWMRMYFGAGLRYGRDFKIIV